MRAWFRCVDRIDGAAVNDRKRHLLTNTMGLPMWLIVHAANVQDPDGLGLLCAGIRRGFPWLQQLFADAGCQSAIARWTAAGERLRPQNFKRPCDADELDLRPRRLSASLPFLRRIGHTRSAIERTSPGSAAIGGSPKTSSGSSKQPPPWP